MRWRRAAQLVLAVGLPLRAAGAHYTCGHDEVVGEVQGETGVVCGPRCHETTFDCPTDVPSGTAAQPQCVLQDIDQAAYCGLLCQVDSQCPSGDSCRRIGNAEVSVCVHPMSFGEWATQASRKKLAVGFPSRAGKSAPGVRIAEAYAALQRLKRRYGVADGDPDVLTVKELLSAASASPQSVKAPAPAPGGLRHDIVRGFGANAFSHDVGYFAGNMERGLPGIEQEVHDTIWNVEHIERYGVAQELLRGVVMLGLVYLVGGAVYKSQALGATGPDMIPHIGFWREYPALVADGMKYTADLVSEFLGKPPPSSGFGGSSSSSGGFQPIGASDRDTFAAFEPSK